MRKYVLLCASSLILLALFIACGYSDDSVIAGGNDEPATYEYEYYYTDSDIEEQAMNHAITGLSHGVKASNGYDVYVNDIDRQEPAINTETPDDSNTDYSGNSDDNREKEVHKLDTKPDSIGVLVNKEYALPEDYIPKKLVKPDVNYYGGDSERRYLRKEAASALEKMFNAAKEDNIYFYGVSGYRSYKRQKEVYNNKVNSGGNDRANKVSAKPGHSEHQTGLSIDISTSSLGGELSLDFAETEAGKWISKNSYKYGFIIRYPKGKESITGYSYEPWHIRYVGKKIAKYIHKNKITLEEYYDYTISIEDLNEITSDEAR